MLNSQTTRTFPALPQPGTIDQPVEVEKVAVVSSHIRLTHVHYVR